MNGGNLNLPLADAIAYVMTLLNRRPSKPMLTSSKAFEAAYSAREIHAILVECLFQMAEQAETSYFTQAAFIDVQTFAAFPQKKDCHDDPYEAQPRSDTETYQCP